MKLQMKNKGITLISLIVTIIILLILAGMVLSLTIGERGIFTTAQNSKKEMRIATVKESIELSRMEYASQHEGKEPTARYIIEDIIRQNLIRENDVVEYGDDTGIGIISVEGEQINIKGNISSIFMLWEFSDNIIKLYPKIRGSNTYGDYAANILYGKTEEEIKDIYDEGIEYWGEEIDWDTCEHGYYEENLIAYKYVKPQEYDFNKEEIVKNFSLIYENEVVLRGNTSIPIIEFEPNKDGVYKFTLVNEEDGAQCTVEVGVGNPVAQIGNEYYYKLQDAFNTVPKNRQKTEVILLSDIEEFVDIVENQNIELQLNQNVFYCDIENEGEILIKNGRVNGFTDMNGIENKGIMTIENVAIYCLFDNWNQCTLNNCDLNIDGLNNKSGTLNIVDSKYEYPYIINNAIYNAQNSTVNISGNTSIDSR